MKKVLLVLTLMISIKSFSQPIKALSINLYAFHNGSRDLETGCVAFFDPMWSDSVNLDDARVLSNPLENIAILRNNVLLAAEKRTTYANLPLRLWHLQNGVYEIQIIPFSITNAYFEVIDSNKLYHITDSFVYRFSNSTVCLNDTNAHYRIVFCNVLALSPTPIVVVRDKHTEFKVYPNPVTSNTLKVEMNKMPLGKYNMILYGSNSKRVFEIKHFKDGVEVLNVEGLQTGLYTLLIEDEMRNRYTKQILIEQLY